MIGLWLFCLMPLEQPQRVTFDVQIFYDQRSVIASMALNQAPDGRFSIACRKSPSGTIFTYWGTESQNVLWFPRTDAAFSGGKDEVFGLFPGGPSMDRHAWLALLLNGPEDAIGSFQYQKDGDWHMLADHPRKVIIRWREKNRRSLKRLSSRALTPRIDDAAERYPFRDFSAYWAEHGFD